MTTVNSPEIGEDVECGLLENTKEHPIWFDVLGTKMKRES
jgi:hypothetical protein